MEDSDQKLPDMTQTELGRGLDAGLNAGLNAGRFRGLGGGQSRNTQNHGYENGSDTKTYCIALHRKTFPCGSRSDRHGQTRPHPFF